MSNLDLEKKVERGEEVELSQSLVGRVLRSIKGFDTGAVDWVDTHSGNFLKTASGWFVSLSEIGTWYEWADAIA